jgi:hypothetical protein
MTDKAKAALVGVSTITDGLIKEMQVVIKRSQPFGWMGFKQPQGRWLYYESARYDHASNT